MSYQELYEQAITSNTVEVLDINIKEFTEEDNILIGKLLKIDTIPPKEGKLPCKNYVFDTDNGKESCILGPVIDKILNTQSNIGQVFAIHYLGEKTSGKGTSFKDYSIIKLNPVKTNAKK